MSEHAQHSTGHSRTPRRAAKPIAFAIFVLAILFVGGRAYFAPFNSDAIASGVSIAGLDVGGRTRTEALRLLSSRLQTMTLVFDAAGSKMTLKPAVLDKNPADQATLAFDAGAAVANAWNIGRENGKAGASMDRLEAYLVGIDLPVPYHLDRDSLTDELRRRFADRIVNARNADFKVDLSGGAVGVSVISEKPGTTLAFEVALREAESRLQRLSNEPILVPQKDDKPAVTADQLEPLKADVATAVDRAQITLTAKKLTWRITPSMAAKWIVPLSVDGGVELGLDRGEVEKFLLGIAPELKVEAKNAVFDMADGRVIKLEASQDGESLDLDSAFALIERRIIKPDPDTAAAPIDLPLVPVSAEVTTESSNTLGIKEIIGTGSSNFRGSPANRRSNIGVGAKTLDGVIVPAGEEFSLLKTLGAIDEEHGYLKELVIKDNKTTPEFGGGLCQIGSTTFRAALNSGLPITERQNHSYRVPYYERDGDGNDMGPGKDATIYDPAPDFKFVNDTGAAIVIKTAIKGNKLTFTFWGRKDGRTQEQSPVEVTNIKPPPEKKTIETADLKPGEVKCTEKPHAGADAVFYYTVTYPDGTKRKKEFFSRYKPWGEVCLIGIDPAKAALAPGTGALPSEDVAGAAGN